MAIKPDWNVVGDALQQWIAADITDAPQRIFVLAKFLFGVSVTSVGLMIAIYKYLDPGWCMIESLALFALAFSAGIALFLAFPSQISLDSDTDLVCEQNRIIRRAGKFTVAWAFTWLLAVILIAASLVDYSQSLPEQDSPRQEAC